MKKMLFVFTFVAACGASFPLPSPVQTAAAVSAGCALVEATGCYQELTAAFPTLTQSSCTGILGEVLNVAEKVRALAKDADREAVAALLSSISEGTVNLAYWDPLGVDIEKLAAMQEGRCTQLVQALGVRQ